MPHTQGESPKYDWRKLIDKSLSMALRVLGQAAFYWLTGRGGHLR